jgi:hypothetical protein
VPKMREVGIGSSPRPIQKERVLRPGGGIKWLSWPDDRNLRTQGGADHRYNRMGIHLGRLSGSTGLHRLARIGGSTDCEGLEESEGSRGRGGAASAGGGTRTNGVIGFPSRFGESS